MNITIILPAVQVVRRESDSPQPTTPFPPVTATPSQSSFSASEYQQILEEYNRRFHGEIQELSESQADIAARQVAYDYSNEPFEETPSPAKFRSQDFPEQDDFQVISRNVTTESPSSP